MGKLPKISKPGKPPIQNLGDTVNVRYGISLTAEKLIGRFVTEWSRLDAIIGDTIWTILDVTIEDGRILTARIDANMKISWLRSFSEKYLENEDIIEMGKILNSVDNLLEVRNFIVHASWGTFVKTGDPVAMSLKMKAPPERVVVESFPEMRLRELVEEIRATRSAIATWRKKHESSPKRRTQPLYRGVKNPQKCPES